MRENGKVEGMSGTTPARKKVLFIGHRPPGRFAVYYYRRSRKIVAVVPGGGRDQDWERLLESAVVPAPQEPFFPDEKLDRVKPDRIYVTYTDEAVHPNTHRAAYRHGDTPVTPSAREILQRRRSAARARRATMLYQDRHPKSALREARAVYADALSRACEDLSKEMQAQRQWFRSRFLRSVRPTGQMWRRLRVRGVPPVETMFTAIDYSPKVRFTIRQKRAVLAIANNGPLSLSPEGAKYCNDVLEAQRRHQPVPTLEIPPDAREHWERNSDGELKVCQDPVWRDCYLTACLIRKMRARLYRIPCGCYVFAERCARPRCHVHLPARSPSESCETATIGPALST